MILDWFGDDLIGWLIAGFCLAFGLGLLEILAMGYDGSAMTHMRTTCCFIVLVGLLTVSAQATPDAEMRALEELRQRYEQIREVNRHSQPASDAMRAVDERIRQLGDRMGQDFRVLIDRKRSEGRDLLLDDAVERILTTHPLDWEVIWRAAEVARMRPGAGSQRDEDDEVDSRIGSLRLFLEAEQRIPDGADAERLARFYRDFAHVLAGRVPSGSRIERHDDDAANRLATAWEWLRLTDFSRLPDRGIPSAFAPPATGHPVDADGEPVYFRLPESWEAAENDGERWRWLMQRQIGVFPQWADGAMLELADRWRQFYGTSNLPAGLAAALRELDAGAAPVLRGNIGALHELGDHETVCELDDGIRRFELPEEFRFIDIYRRQSESERRGYAVAASERLAWVFTARGQYEKAAEIRRRAIELQGDRIRPEQHGQLEQLVGNLGRFERHETQPAGRPARLDFVFRNARQATFSARPLDIEGLLEAAADNLDSTPRNFVSWKAELENFGSFLVSQPEWRQAAGEHFQSFLGEIRHEWTVELEPAPGHRDRRVTVETPLDEPGAWFVRAELPDGNVSTILLWIADTVLIRKPTPGGMMYLVRDARDGSPVAGAEIELLGHSSRGRDSRRRHLRTDGEGVAVLPLDGPGQDDLRLEWMAVARTDDGRLAYLGFENFGTMWRWGGPGVGRPGGFMVSDRPVYRPGDEVRLKLWFWTSAAEGEEAGVAVMPPSTLHVRDTANREVWTTDLLIDDERSAIAGFTLPEGASPGVWRFEAREGDNRAFHSVQVITDDEPELGVVVKIPEEPIRSGDTFEAVIRVTDQAGGPVRDAAVHYKVSRRPHGGDWSPPAAWDWLYGAGYSWLPPTAEWHPRFRYRGGGELPSIYLVPVSTRWDLVAEGGTATGPDGTVRIGVDTGVAALLHPDIDHQYMVSAMVADGLGNTGTGGGSVLATRHPFEVLVVPERGFHDAGSLAVFTIHARTPGGGPVVGSGELRLLLRAYDGERDLWVERETARSAFILDGKEPPRIDLPMAAVGRNRVTASVLSEAGERVEGGVFTLVRGDGEESQRAPFNALELIPEKAEYRPGETARLLINSNRADALVEVYARPERAGYERPVLFQLQGKSGVFELPLDELDQPSLFVEAVMVDDGRMRSEARRIVVPPVAGVLDVRVKPSATRIVAGGNMGVVVRLRDAHGVPVRGEVAVAVHDRALDALAGVTRKPDIRASQLGGTRRYEPFLRNSLVRPTRNAHPQATARWAVRGGQAANAEQHADDVFVPGGGPMPVAGRGKRPYHEILADRVAARAQPFEVPARDAFLGSVLWADALETDAEGRVRLEFDVPPHEAEWIIRAWAVGSGDRSGQGSAGFSSIVEHD